ncbi:signal peptidase I [Leifsonia sp. 2MCAF36]|uniref:signal peptidase I n=1 Tax=Leifsonia sp. 2MCAF36 TaxID=3232988 RepID=UPI003F982047
MTVMPRIPSRKPKPRRSSFVAPVTRTHAVPDALSWRQQLDNASAPKGPAAWSAASRTQLDRMVIDAGPYGLIDLATAEPLGGVAARNQHLGVVWWDRRSFREEDDDDGTIQTSFVPASISDHVSLAPSWPSSPSAPLDQPTVWTLGGSAPEVLAPPVQARRPGEPDESEHKRHARRSRHVALVPTRSARARPTISSHPRRAMLRRRRTRRRVILGAILVIVAFGATVLIQGAIFTPFNVPSASMENTLHSGDRILVNKFAYGASPIHRGDVVVFTDPGGWLDRQSGQAAGNDHYLVKRVIGIPGDHVSCCSTAGRVTVNGTELDEQFAVIPVGSPSTATPFDVTVPAGDLWVLGDNRYNSRDSSQTQVMAGRGFVPIANVVGQAVFKLWPLTEAAPIGTARETFASIRDETCPI